MKESFWHCIVYVYLYSTTNCANPIRGIPRLEDPEKVRVLKQRKDAGSPLLEAVKLFS